MYDQVAELVESLLPLIRVALRVLSVFAIGIGMFIVIILQEAYLQISDQFVRTYLYALLFILLLFMPGAAILHGGWWWLGPPLTLVFTSLVMRVDSAEPRQGWLHPWS